MLYSGLKMLNVSLFHHAIGQFAGTNKQWEMYRGLWTNIEICGMDK